MRQTDYVILGLLEDEPMTGYEIKKLIDIRFKFFWSESFGQIFPALKNLLNFKLIEELQWDSDSKRKKKIYKITKKGEEELKNWLMLPVEKETVRFEILVKMYFSKLVDSSFMIEHINNFISIFG